MMSAFIDPEATITKTVPCQCPEVDGKPRHPDGDTVTAKARVGMADMARIQRALFTTAGTDPFSQRLTILEVALKDWTFENARGEVVPIGNATIALLDPELGSELVEWIDEEWEKAKLPNASGARSRPSSQASSGAAPKRSPKR